MSPRQPPDAQISSFAATEGIVIKSLEQTGSLLNTSRKKCEIPQSRDTERRRSQPIGWSATYTGA